MQGAGEREGVSTRPRWRKDLAVSFLADARSATEATHWRASNGVLKSKGRRGATVVAPTRTSCKKVLYFEICVG